MCNRHATTNFTHCASTSGFKAAENLIAFFVNNHGVALSWCNFTSKLNFSSSVKIIWHMSVLQLNK